MQLSQRLSYASMFIDNLVLSPKDYQIMMDEVSPEKRSALKSSLKRRHLIKIKEFKKLFKNTAVKLDNLITKYIESGKELTLKNGMYYFNGFRNCYDYNSINGPKNYQHDITSCQVQVNIFSERVDELSKKVKKEIFKGKYKEELKKATSTLHYWKRQLADFRHKQTLANTKKESLEKNYDECKDILKLIDELTYYKYLIQRCYEIIAFMSNKNINGLSPAQFSKEFKQIKLDVPSNLLNQNVIESITTQNDYYMNNIYFANVMNLGLHKTKKQQKAQAKVEKSTETEENEEQA